ncbi:hypothetical protein ONZ45_g3122 [Pleurotus djamor]|nr:hypothetical protein ONZ45_g3122 [Pleurotus djamor]
MLGSLLFLSLVVALATARPSNDWSKPCLDGECAYDLPDGSKNGYGTLKIFGGPASISDITPAAGWVVLECDENSLEQKIRLVCRDGDESQCGHLFSHHGAVDKIVRLPENCGANPFARIAGHNVAEDQSIPRHIPELIKRKVGTEATVHALKIDVNFAAIDATKTGPVSFAVVGANFPVSMDPDQTTSLHARDMDGLFDKIKKGLKSAVDTVKTAVKQIGKFDANPKISKALDFQQHLDLLNLHQTCGNSSLTLNVAVDGKAHADISAGIVATGTIIPPHFDKFGAYAGLSADVEAKLHVDAKLQGNIDTGRKQLVKLTIPGFGFPGVFSVGPMLVVDGQVVAQLDMSFAVDVSVGYRLDGVELWVPPSAGRSATKSLRPKDTPLQLSAGTNFDAIGDITGHLFPSVKLGVEGLGGAIKVDAFLDVDAYAKLHLNAQASTSKNKRDVASGSGSYAPPYSTSARALAQRAAQSNDASTFTGCLDLRAGIAITGGAEGKVPFLGDLSKKFNIFSKEFQIIKKCWNGGVMKRGISRATTGSELEGRNIALGPICPKVPAAAADLSPVDAETISANNIQ